MDSSLVGGVRVYADSVPLARFLQKEIEYLLYKPFGDVSMAVQANDVSNGSGIDVRICFLQSYNRLVSKGGGDKCAEAFAQGPPPSTAEFSTSACSAAVACGIGLAPVFRA